jgi:hypothetical protein
MVVATFSRERSWWQAAQRGDAAVPVESAPCHRGGACGRRIDPMHGLFDVDVTEARRLLSVPEPPLSLTAFIIASVARAVAAHPQVHAYRNWRGRLVETRRPIRSRRRSRRESHGSVPRR